MMKLGLFLPAVPDVKWQLARQAGIDYAITKAAPELTGMKPIWDFATLAAIHERFREAGFQLLAIEGDEFDMSRIKLGLPGRDEDLEHYCAMLSNMGRLEIPLLCYNFMAGVGWYRNHVAIKTRGGALTNGYFPTADPEPPLLLSHEELWDNYAYFLRAVLPAAAAAGVRMGLHPDDPPLSSLQGYPRIMCSAAAFRRAKALADSPAWGISFCQGTFRSMGEDLLALIPEFKDDIVFVHARDVELRDGGFMETFHDNGPTDMVAVLREYRRCGVRCLLRPDHAPTMAGEDNSSPGYAIMGRLLGAAHLRGIMRALEQEGTEK
jgi:mannonate dehydratase